MKIWESTQKNFPYHQVSYFADYVNDFRTITIIAKDDYVYSPDDTDFLKMNQQDTAKNTKIMSQYSRL